MKIVKILGASLFLIAAMSVAVAQNPTRPAGLPQANKNSKVQADETFTLDIKEKHIQERDFHASTALEIGSDDPSQVKVQVGVALTAATIDVTLRNVTGQVRFRGSLQSILDLLKSRPESRPPREK